jgi:hypothetical protein
MSTQNSDKTDRSTLLKEAILDAKMVKAVALANAKLVVEEQFTPRLQSMLSKKIQQEVEGEDAVGADDEASDIDDIQPDPQKPVAQAPAQAPAPIAPEAPITPAPSTEAPVEQPAPEAQIAPTADVPATAPEAPAPEVAPSIPAQEPAPIPGETTDVPVAPGSTEQEGDDIDVEALIKELSIEAPTETQPVADGQGDDDDDVEINLESLFDKDGIEPDANATQEPSQEKVDETASTGEITDAEIEDLLREIKSGSEEDDSDEEDKDDESKRIKEENISLSKKLNEALDTVQYLRDRINEINVLNSKLLYTNKLFKEHTLNVNQKGKVFEAFDRSQSVRETKLIYNTLCESFKSGKETTAPQRKLASVTSTITEGLASKSIASTKPTKPEVILESANSDKNELRSRLMQLAGISSKQR